MQNSFLYASKASCLCWFFAASTSAIVTALCVNLIGNDTAYRYVWLLPSSYFIAAFFLFDAAKRLSAPKAIWVYLFLSYLQSVLYVAIVAYIGPDFLGRRYLYLSDGMLIDATFYIAITNISVAFFFFILSFSTPFKAGGAKKYPFPQPVLGGSRLIYFLFLIIAFAVFVMTGFGSGLVSFVFSYGSANVRELSQTDILLRQVLWIAIVLVFLLTLSWASKKYHNGGGRKYLFISILAAVLLISVVIGGRRSVQIFAAALSLWMLIIYFPRERFKVGVALILPAMISVFLITVERGSIFSAIQMGANPFGQLGIIADYIQVYTGGVDSIATGVLLGSAVDVGVGNVFFDFLRTTFGLNFLFRDSGLLTSEIYNEYLYSGDQRTGQLIFAISYGVIFLGLPGAPLFVIINILYAMFFERMFHRSVSLEAKFFFGYCFLRVATNSLVNTPTLNTIVTMQAGTLGLVFLAAFFFKKMFGGRR